MKHCAGREILWDRKKLFIKRLQAEDFVFKILKG